jgi:mono/diheme cytochrome c family protein
LAEHARGLADGQIFHIVTHGQGLMPAHGSQVAQEDRWKIVHYIRSLQSPARTAQKDTP